MKKLISLLLVLLLAAAPALAETAPMPVEENAVLTLEEVQMYLDKLGKEAAQAADVLVESHEAGVTAYAPQAELAIADETLTANTAVLAAQLRPEVEDLRGIELGASLADVMAVYPNDNPDLYGTFYEATLYVADSRPEAALGFILRDGQRVTSVVHYVLAWADESVIRAGVVYGIEDDTVVSITVRGEAERIEESEALEQIADLAEMQEVREYFAYPVSAVGTDLAAFEREDLSFGGLDFLDLTPEMAENVLGESPVDDWMEDSTGEFVRTRQWDGVSILFQYDAQKNFLHVSSMTLDTEALDGPRGVRVGDMLDSVMNRFLHGENTALANGIGLYGDGVNPPYGVVEYGEKTATLAYAFSLEDGRTIHWRLTFIDGELMTQTLMLR